VKSEISHTSARTAATMKSEWSVNPDAEGDDGEHGEKYK